MRKIFYNQELGTREVEGKYYIYYNLKCEHGSTSIKTKVNHKHAKTDRFIRKNSYIESGENRLLPGIYRRKGKRRSREEEREINKLGRPTHGIA